MLGGVKSAGKFAAGLATAAAGAVTALVGVATSAATTSDEIDKASQRMGVTAEGYQELAHAASLCGVDMTTMEKAAKKLEGTDISFDDAMEQIYALSTAEERSAKAAELFGETVAYQMSPMLNASADDMAAMKQEARDLGLVLSDDAVKSGAELNDAISNVKDSIGALGTKLGASLMPIVKEACDAIIEFMPTIQAIVDQIGPVLSDLLAALLPILMDLVKQLLPPLLELVEALLPLFQLLCELILPIIIKLVEYLAKFLVDYVIPAITKVVNAVKYAVEHAGEYFEAFKSKVVGIFNAIKEGVKKPINAVIGFINGLVSGVTDGINAVIKAMNAMSFEVPDWVPVLGGKKFGFDLKELTAPQIPLLANGGNVVEEGKAIVGEAGAELIDVPRGATVTPLTRGEDALNTKEIVSIMYEMLDEMKEQQNNMINAFAQAINGSSINWDDRQLGRLVNKYAR